MGSTPNIKPAISFTEVRNLRKRTLLFSFWDGLMAAAMVGSAETFAIYFALKQHLSFNQIATITTFPLVVAAFAQALIPAWVRSKTLKANLLLFVGVQILGLAGLVASVKAEHKYETILGSLILYWLGGMVAQPLWLDWISGWMPQKTFSKFFARRNAYTSFITLLVYVVWGVAVWKSESLDTFLYVFLFSLACRVAGFLFLVLQKTPEFSIHKKLSSEDYPLKKIFLHKAILWSLVFTVVFKFAVQFSAAYFNPYIIDELKFDLLHFVGITAIPFVGRTLFFTGWGEASKKLRPFIGLQIAMFCIALNPTLWTYTKDFRYLCVFELMSGTMWGGFELCSILIVSEMWPGESRKLFGIHFALMSLASLVGAYVGAHFFDAGWAYREMFVLSSDLRLSVAIVYSVLMSGYAETRASLQGYSDYLIHVLTLRPTYMLSRLSPIRKRLRFSKYDEQKKKIKNTSRRR